MEHLGPGIEILQQFEMVFSTLQNTVLSHPGQLFGQGGAFQVQVVRQLLPVEGDIEFGGILLEGNAVQIRQDTAPGAFG